MESIIVAILFTYPGAFAEFTYWRLAKDAPFYQKPEEYFRIARVFFLSAVITLACLLLFGWFEGGLLELSNAVHYLEQGNNAIHYCLLSVIVSVLLGVGWYGLACLWQSAKNKWKTDHEKATDGKYKQVWMSMLADRHTPQMNYVVEIRKNGTMVQCGLIYHMPDDLRTDTGFALMHCELVKKYMDNPEYDIISEPLVNYIDLEHDAEIVIRDATAFTNWLAGEEM